MPRRVLEGNVVGNKTDKTITVLVERRFRHPVYKKYVKHTDKYSAHDPNNQYNIGDRVSIIECRPISKTKRWIVTTADGQQNAPVAKAPVKKAAPAPKKAESKTEAKEAAPKKEPAAKKPAAKKTTAKAASKKKDA